MLRQNSGIELWSNCAGPWRRRANESDRQARAVDQSAEFDHELVLARELSKWDLLDSTGEIPESVTGLSADEIQEFLQAQECLLILNQITPETQIENGPTCQDRRGDTPPWFDWESQGTPPRIGRFKIEEELGRGGFGIVLKAHDPSLNRSVALKIPHLSCLLRQDLLKRFEREAKAAALLSHPGIIPIFETNRIGPLHYIAYEYCDGPTLAQWFDEHPDPDPEVVAGMMRQLADAVQYAHSRGLVHRDLKPVNILCVAPDEQDPSSNSEEQVPRLRITDFGLAALHGEAEDLTADNALVGTPAYMSPEQINGQAATACSDLYSLGVIFYQLLTGQLPFHGATHLETARMVTEKSPRALRRHNRSIPADLSSICHKCLEKKPADRYQDCQQLSDDLKRFVDGRPVLANRPSIGGLAWRWCRRNPVSASLAGTLLLVMLASSLVMLFLWQSSVFHERQSEARARQAVTQTRRLRSAVDELLVAIAEEPSIRSHSMEPFRKKLLNSAGAIYRDLIVDVPDDSQLLHELGETMAALSSIHAKLGEPEKAIELVGEVRQIFENSGTRMAPSLQIELLQLRATSLRFLGRYREAEDCQAEAIEIARTIAETHPDSKRLLLDWVRQLNQAAAGRIQKKDFAGATQFIDQAFEALASVYGQNTQDWPMELECYLTLKHKASLSSQIQRQAEAKELGLEALDRLGQLRKIEAISDPEATEHLVSVNQTIGLTGSHSGDYALAEKHYDLAINATEQLMGQHPQVAKYAQNRIGLLYSRALIDFFQKEYDAALETLKSSVKHAENLRAGFPEMATGFYRHEANSLNLMYGVHRRRGDDSRAQNCLEKAIGICDVLLRRNEHDFQSLTMKGNFLGNLGFLYSNQSKHSESKQSYLESIEILEPVVESQGQGESVTFLLSSYLGAMTQADKLEQFDLAMEYSSRFLKLANANDARRDVVMRERAKWHAFLEEYEQAELHLMQLKSGAQSAESTYEISVLAAECASILVERQSLNEGAESWWQRFESLAIDLLKAAVEMDRGATDSTVSVDRLIAQQEFQVLHGSKKWREILETLRPAKILGGSSR